MMKILVLVLLSGVTVFGQSNDGEAPEYRRQCTPPTLNAECIRESCPNLFQTCPYSTTGCSQSSSMLSQCLYQPPGVYCDVVQHCYCGGGGDIPQLLCSYHSIIFQLNENLQGSCLPKEGQLFPENSVPDVTVCVTGSGPVNVSISARNVTSFTTYDCVLTPPLKKSFVPLTFDLKLRVDMDLEATVDLGPKMPTVLSYEVKSYSIANEVSNAMFPENKTTAQVAADVANSTAYTLKAEGVVGQFLANFVASALTYANRTCVL